jgi:hypothetical protein
METYEYTPMEDMHVFQVYFLDSVSLCESDGFCAEFSWKKWALKSSQHWSIFFFFRGLYFMWVA